MAVITVNTDPAVLGGPSLVTFVLNEHAGGERSMYWFITVPLPNLKSMARGLLQEPRFTWDGKEIAGFDVWR